MKVAKADGVCLVCRRPVILIIEDDEVTFWLFHKDPPCEAFNGDPESTYGQHQVNWPEVKGN